MTFISAWLARRTPILIPIMLGVVATAALARPGLMFAPYDALMSADSSSMAATAAGPALRSQ